MVRRILRVVLWGVALLVTAVGAFLAYVAVRGIPHYKPEPPNLAVQSTPERVARGRKLASMLCADCHLNQATGALTGKEMADAPKEFGRIFSRNITRHPTSGIGGWTDGDIAYLLRTGIAKDGRYVPPWMTKQPHMSDEDIASVIAFLRSDDPWVQPNETPSRPVEPSFLSKLLSYVAFGPLPYPPGPIAPPDTKDEVALGQYYAHVLDCFACHSADFKKMDDLHPQRSAGYFGGGNTMFDSAGATVVTANLTPDDETGIGKWSRDEFVRALKKGFGPGDRPLRAPMGVYPELTDAEAGAIYAYLRTVPKIHNSIPRGAAAGPAVAGGPPGKQVYERYGCRGCHGDTGAGTCDLRGAGRKYATNDALAAFIRKPIAVVPDSKMPAWEGIIKEDEYGPLCEYVRQLQASGETASAAGATPR